MAVHLFARSGSRITGKFSDLIARPEFWSVLVQFDKSTAQDGSVKEGDTIEVQLSGEDTARLVTHMKFTNTERNEDVTNCLDRAPSHGPRGKK